MVGLDDEMAEACKMLRELAAPVLGRLLHAGEVYSSEAGEFASHTGIFMAQQRYVAKPHPGEPREIPNCCFGRAFRVMPAMQQTNAGTGSSFGEAIDCDRGNISLAPGMLKSCRQASAQTITDCGWRNFRALRCC